MGRQHRKIGYFGKNRHELAVNLYRGRTSDKGRTSGAGCLNQDEKVIVVARQSVPILIVAGKAWILILIVADGIEDLWCGVCSRSACS